MKIVVLGSGTSHGIPMVGCDCPVCTSNDPRDKRMRSSVYIEGAGGERALIDAGPEFRLQALRAGINRLDAIFLTHAHADHIHGLDDVRPLSRNNPIPVYGNERTIAEMKERFSYVFRTTGAASQRGGGKPKLGPRVIDGPVQIGGLRFTPVPVKHGILDILGWEIQENTPGVRETAAPLPEAGRSFLYLTDTSAIPPAVLARLTPGGNSGRPRSILIGALRIRPHETHFNFEQALNTALSLGAGQVYLTHICHDLSHKKIEEFCRNFRQNNIPESRKREETYLLPAHDGLEIIL